MDRARLQALVVELGVTLGLVQGVQHAPNFEEAQRRLAALKEVAKAGYRKLALKYHPDRNPGDEAAASAKFMELTKVHAELQELRVNPPQPMPVLVAVRTNYAAAVRSVSNSGAATPYDARRVVDILW